MYFTRPFLCVCMYMCIYIHTYLPTYLRTYILFIHVQIYKWQVPQRAPDSAPGLERRGGGVHAVVAGVGLGLVAKFGAPAPFEELL